MSEWVCLNGEIVASREAAIPANDAGLLHGAGLFETIRVVGASPFRLSAHIERLRRSATALGMPVPTDVASWPADIARLLEANRLSDARLRITLTPGPVGSAGAGDESDFRGTVLITAVADSGYPSESYERGMTAAICPYRVSDRDPVAGHKTTCYLPRLLALHAAREKQCAESLWFTTQGRLAEGCISNVFLVSDGRVRTPPRDTPVLPGITRGAVLELLSAGVAPASEEELTIDDLLAAREVFITNAMMGVMPVTHLERHVVGDGIPGAVTRRLIAEYRNLVQRETSPDP